jgi:serine/threonine-protein kinase HipA
MVDSLSVWWGERIAGTLTRDTHGDMGFVYDAKWLADAKTRPISQSLPKREEPYGRSATRPFFAGLLPEEDALRGVARAIGVSDKNDFGLLDELGGDVAGALTLWPQGTQPPVYDGTTAREPLSDDRLVEILEKLPARPLLAGEDGLRVSLAGAQAKLPVVLVDNRIALPAPGQPTTHILKPPIRRFKATTENEALAMQLAAAFGLDVAGVEPRIVKGRTLLLVERYDRLPGPPVTRLHQEDFCQAIGISPEHKYAKEGGPTFKTSFGLLRNCARQPAVDTLRLLDAVLFNMVIGNADAHGKNFSLLYAVDGTRLAPLYDLMCTIAMEGTTQKLAMQFDGLSDPATFKPRTWSKFAEAIEIGAPFVRRRVAEVASHIRDLAPQVAARLAEHGFDSEGLDHCVEIIRARSQSAAVSI